MAERYIVDHPDSGAWTFATAGRAAAFQRKNGGALRVLPEAEALAEYQARNAGKMPAALAKALAGRIAALEG